MANAGSGEVDLRKQTTIQECSPGPVLWYHKTEFPRGAGCLWKRERNDGKNMRKWLSAAAAAAVGMMVCLGTGGCGNGADGQVLQTAQTAPMLPTVKSSETPSAEPEAKNGAAEAEVHPEKENTETSAEEKRSGCSAEYEYREVPLVRNGVDLHLVRISREDREPEKDILLVHGVTYSSHEFDIPYQDYSLARKLAENGYGVWLLDIAGFGQSGTVGDGFLPDSDYAAEDVNAAAEKITEISGREKTDVLGWSWGTVTVSRFAAAHPEHIGKLVLYAPILSGVGEFEVTEPFHRNTWEHAAEDFQKTKDGAFDDAVSDPVLREVWCSNCWHYDGESSPNGGRRDICVAASRKLIDLSAISNRTLVICGDQDPYLNYDLVKDCLRELPEGSELEIIPGGSHVVYAEKPYYHDFQDRLLRYLSR